MKVETEYVIDLFEQLDTTDKIDFLEYCFRKHNHKYEYATMCPSLRKFYSNEERGK